MDTFLANHRLDMIRDSGRRGYGNLNNMAVVLTPLAKRRFEVFLTWGKAQADKAANTCRQLKTVAKLDDDGQEPEMDTCSCTVNLSQIAVVNFLLANNAMQLS